MAGDVSDRNPREEPRRAARPAGAGDWEEFYTELIEFEERVLVSMRELSAGMTKREQEAVRRTDLEPLEELIDDLRRRLDLWRTRIRSEDANR